jgi:hypothetical protein
VLEVARAVVERHGGKLTAEVQRAAAGRRPLEAWQATIELLGLENVTAQALFDESEPILKERYVEAMLERVGRARVVAVWFY